MPLQNVQTTRTSLSLLSIPDSEIRPLDFRTSDAFLHLETRNQLTDRPASFLWASELDPADPGL